ncbi:GIY-YIG nuclease family protein [Geitlerinema sp. CS-897]|nr:GIY-YIG nuclease family protein [Geitlerinema sp. CS-897]
MTDDGIVYQIKNNENGKIYVGCTTNFASRIGSYVEAAKNGTLNTALYRDMREDITKFSFSILEQGIARSELRQRESEWIVNKKSIQKGYNAVRKSGNERLSEEEVREIRDCIQNTRLKFYEIAEIYGMQRDIISDINLGRAWFDPLYEYPLRKNTVKRKKLTEEDVLHIYSLLRDPNLSFSEIASLYGWRSEAVLRKINNGTYSVSPLTASSYPIRSVDSRKGNRKR